MKETSCLGERHYSNTNIKNEYEKINPEIQKNFKAKRGECDICGRAKSQIFTK